MPISQKQPEYLGDGVYITPWGHGVMLTANHHLPEEATDVIYLEGVVITSLLRYLNATVQEEPT